MRRSLEDARASAVEALRWARDFVRRADWVRECFSDARLCDVEGLVTPVDRAEIEAHNWSLTPGRYVGVTPEEEDEDFDFGGAFRAIHVDLKGLNEEEVLRGSVPVEYRDAQGHRKSARARVIDFDNAPGSNRFLAVRELKLTGIRTPNYNRRADLICFVNGLPLVFIELKAVYRNIREGFDANLSDYMDENVIAHAFHHNAFLIVSNGDRARYGSITSDWEHFAEWKRLDEADKGSLDAEVMLNGMLAHDRLLDIVENFILFDESKPGATRTVIARNHQVLGVNRAVASVARQEELKLEFPPGAAPEAIASWSCHSNRRAPAEDLPALPMAAEPPPPPYIPEGPVDIVERAIPSSVGSECSGTPRGAGSPIPWPSSREGAAEAGRQLHVPADDRSERSRRPDLPNLRRVWYRGRQHAAGRVGRRSGATAEGELPLRLQPDPQVQQGCRSETALTASATTSS